MAITYGYQKIQIKDDERCEGSFLSRNNEGYHANNYYTHEELVSLQHAVSETLKRLEEYPQPQKLSDAHEAPTITVGAHFAVLKTFDGREFHLHDGEIETLRRILNKNTKEKKP